MSTKLNGFLREIFEKTGTEVYLEARGGEETAFPLEYGGEKSTAYLSGTGREAERTARLVQYLAAELAEPSAATLKGILLGEANRRDIYRFMSEKGVRDRECYAIELAVSRRPEEAYSHIESCLAETGALLARMEETRFAAVVFPEKTQLPVELAGFLTQSLYEELGVHAGAGIGCEVKSFAEISRSYAQAATAVRMSEMLKSKGEVHTYREYLLVKLLEDIPEGKLKEYIAELHITGEEVFGDEELTQTAETFLENSLNISETSRDLFMHRNTLMYRLDKLERLTGLNIRNFSDAVTFRVLTLLYKLLR